MALALAPTELTVVRNDGFVHFGDVLQLAHCGETAAVLAADTHEQVFCWLLSTLPLNDTSSMLHFMPIAVSTAAKRVKHVELVCAPARALTGARFAQRSAVMCAVCQRMPLSAHARGHAATI